MARAKKVKCPSCGAKNNADDRRCRVCTKIINTDAAEPDDKPKLDATESAAHQAAATAGIQIGDQAKPFSQTGRSGPSKLSAALDKDDVAGLQAGKAALEREEAARPVYEEEFVPIEIDEQSVARPPEPASAPPPPPADAEAEIAAFASGGLDIDPTKAPRPHDAPGAPPPDPDAEAEIAAFAGGGLDIDPTKAPRPHDAPGAPPPDPDAEAEAAAFRLGDLDIDDPTDPRPS